MTAITDSNLGLMTGVNAALKKDLRQSIKELGDAIAMLGKPLSCETGDVWYATSDIIEFYWRSFDIAYTLQGRTSVNGVPGDFLADKDKPNRFMKIKVALPEMTDKTVPVLDADYNNVGTLSLEGALNVLRGLVFLSRQQAQHNLLAALNEKTQLLERLDNQ